MNEINNLKHKGLDKSVMEDPTQEAVNQLLKINKNPYEIWKCF